jgi:VWFA-related protein
MLSATVRLTSSIALVLFIALAVGAQTRPTRPKPRATPTPVVTDPDTPAEQKDIETLRTDTNLVTVPVIATNRTGTYLADLTKDEFVIVEDGVKQEIAFFSHVSAPFHVVLMLDTSASTQEKLSLIQKAAYTFVQQLQTADRVKVISFDDEVRDLNEFTNDRELLRVAINKTKSGNGTRVYDAVSLALNTLRPIQGRKAIVVFTDGVDWHSLESTFDGTLRWLDEEGVIVYPIRYDTRAATERIAREQSDGISPTLPTIGVVRQTPGVGTLPPAGTTPKTFPSEDPIPSVGTSRS